MTCAMKDSPVHFATPTYLPRLGTLSKTHFLSLSVSPYLQEHAGLSENAASGAAAPVWPGGALGAL